MQKYCEMLMQTKLFAGVDSAEIAAMLGCLGAAEQRFARDAYVLRQGEEVNRLAVLAEGRLHVRRDDYWGNRSIISVIDPGEMFGEAYIAPGSGPLASDVVAVTDSTVLFFDAARLLGVCPSACRFHSLTVRNLFFALSEKNRHLLGRLDVATRRSTREKLIAYLSGQARRHGTADFRIPLNRQQLADYLSVDRSAMSAELCRMRDEGMLRFDKNHFELLEG